MKDKEEKKIVPKDNKKNIEKLNVFLSKEEEKRKIKK